MSKDKHTQYDTGADSWAFLCVKDATHNYLGPCPACGSRTYEYGGGYACVKMYCPRHVSNIVCNNGPMPDWWDTDILIYMDGDEWCAVGDGFVNIQESTVGFGSTPQEAVEHYRCERSEG